VRDADPPPAPVRFSVTRRLLVTYAVLLVAFAVTMGLGVRDLRNAAEDARLLRSGLVPLQLSVGQALAEQNVLLTQLNHVSAAKNPGDVKEWVETQRRVRPRTLQSIRNALLALGAGGPDLGRLAADGAAELDAIDERQSAESETYAKLFEAVSSGDAARTTRLSSELVKLESETASRFRVIRERAEAAVDRLDQVARNRERRALWLMIGLSSITLVVGVGISLYAQRMLRPLGRVTERAKIVASGDLTPRTAEDDGSEIGELAGTFERMVGAIRDARGQVVQTERLAAIGKMAAHITHEIRNPLSAMSLNLELLESELALRDVEDHEARDLVAAIKAEATRLSRLSEQYLNLARRPVPSLVTESLGELLAELAEFLAPEMKRAGVELRLVVEEDAPDVPVDESLARQAFLNLMRNAREAMADGGHLVVRVERDEEGGALVTVEDDGPGIPEAVRANVFDPFFTTKQRGTGLGLAVTREIVEAHRGTITCEPRSPHGTIFRLRFPEGSRAR
jgi:signal transduction histidine kinase